MVLLNFDVKTALPTGRDNLYIYILKCTNMMQLFKKNQLKKVNELTLISLESSFDSSLAVLVRG